MGTYGEFYMSDLAVDTANHILFVGESGLTGSNLFSFSSSTLQSLSRTTYDKNYGFGFPDRKVIVDGNQVFMQAIDLRIQIYPLFKGPIKMMRFTFKAIRYLLAMHIIQEMPHQTEVMCMIEKDLLKLLNFLWHQEKF